MARRSPNLTDKHVGAHVRMRRVMLDMSQSMLADALGVTFQQVQTYEQGVNRIGAGRLLQISRFLQVPITFFFEGAPSPSRARGGTGTAPSPTYVSDFLASSDGLSLTKAFMQIKDPTLRRR